MIKCTGMNCPMQAGKVDPATCKAADTCKWATKPMTNADRIRAMSDEELTEFLPNLCTNINPRESECLKYGSCYKCVSIWLKQEVKENA